jgi:hypothetical protein
MAAEGKHPPQIYMTAGAMITPRQRHQLLLADISRDVATVTAAVTEVLAANPDATLFDIEMAFRDVGARAYVIASPEPTIVLGMRAWRAALGRAGVSPEENRAALAGTTAKPIGRRAS